MVGSMRQGLVFGVLLVVAGMAGDFRASALQTDALKVEAAVPVFDDAGLPDLVEPWLAVAPDDPQQLVVAALLSDFSASVLARSADGGRSWSRLSQHGNSRFPGGDPFVIAGPNGRVHFSTIDPTFRVWSSGDGGRTWGQPSVVDVAGADRQWLAEDRSGGIRHGHLFAAGKTGVRVFGSRAQDIGFLSTSIDGARTFSPPRLFLPDPEHESLHTVTDLQIDDRGSLLLPYLAFSWKDLAPGPPTPGLKSATYWLTSSPDGRRFSEPGLIADVKLYGHADEALSVKSLGGGRLALDRTSGRFGGRRYFVYPDAASGVSKIMLTRAERDGKWSTPVAVSNGPAGRSESNPMVAVNSAGVIAIVWNDRRADASDNCYQAHTTVSVDGGATFRPSLPLGDHPVCPTAMRWLNGGDTQGLVAVSDGRFVAAWVGQAAGRTNVYTTGISVGATAGREQR
jgi:hypothetical protein